MEKFTINDSNLNLNIVSNDLGPISDEVQFIRPLASTTKSTDQIVGDLVNRFSYKTNEVKATE
jgi:hypothetical protein